MTFTSMYRELTLSTEMIRALLKGIDQEQAQFKPDPATWSMLEVTCHLYDEEREDFREHLDFILHRQHATWHAIDPQRWVTERKYNEQPFDEMQKKFFAERQQSLEWLATQAQVDLTITYTSEYGSVSAGEMFACWVAHDNLHIRQLVELRRRFIERTTRPFNLEYAGEW